VNDQIKKDVRLLCVTVINERYLDDVLLAMTSISGGRITMMETFSGYDNLSQSIPMFGEFLGMGSRTYGKVLMTCTQEPEPVEHFIELLTAAGVDFVKEQIGEVYDIPLGSAVLLDEE